MSMPWLVGAGLTCRLNPREVWRDSDSPPKGVSPPSMEHVF